MLRRTERHTIDFKTPYSGALPKETSQESSGSRKTYSQKKVGSSTVPLKTPFKAARKNKNLFEVEIPYFDKAPQDGFGQKKMMFGFNKKMSHQPKAL